MRKLILPFLIIFTANCLAHPMPNSVLLFDVKSDKIYCELQLPLKELQLAVPFDVTNNLNDLLKNHQNELYKYILTHFHIEGSKHEEWLLSISNMKLANAEQTATGVYQELIVTIKITPADTLNIRNFVIYYNAIIHQVVTHRAIITIRQDWENGQVSDKHSEIGTIALDTRIGKVFPFKVNLGKGNSWKGFKSMVNLGMQHISEGTDHFLFLLVLLLSAPLLSNGKLWTHSGGMKYSLIRIIKITTAFTIGHSITLLMGTLGWFQPSEKPIEILIAVSILVTAIHAIRPIFINKEIYVAAGFGLIHGLAFASVLSHMHLDTNKLVLSLLGFNIGIELMQILVIILVMPWLLILSNYKEYEWIRIFGATLAGIAAIAWLFERYFEESNCISYWIEFLSEYSLWLILGLAIYTILTKVIISNKSKFFS